MNQTRETLVRRLRAANGYSVREARRAVEDVLDALHCALEDLEPGDSLVLKNLGALRCVVRTGRRQRVGLRSSEFVQAPNTSRIRFQPSVLLASYLRSRVLSEEDPRVVDARAHSASLALRSTQRVT